MTPNLTKTLLADLATSVENAIANAGIVNVSLLAQQVQFRNEGDNVALEDIAAEVIRVAQWRGVPMEFDAPLILAK